MKMKLTVRKHIWGFMIAATAMISGGCSLEENPSSFVGSDKFYLTEQQCIAGLNSCYIPLKSIYNYTYMISVEGVTDLMYIRSGTLDAQLDISPSNPRFGATMWQYGYQGVMYSNAVIAGIQRSPLTEEQKRPLIAEGMVMRSLYYWLLTSTFGDVPFYTVDVSDEEVRDQVAKLGRMPATKTREYLVKELKEYVPYLDQIRSSDIKNNRCGAAMGWMLAGKLAMWNKSWEDALFALDKLEKIYGSDLSQYSLDNVLWRNKNMPETIFEIQHTYTAGGLSVVSSCASICTPTRQGANDGYTYDGVEIRELGNKATTWTALRPTPYFFQSLQTRKGTDLRAKLNLAWEYDGHEFAGAKTAPWPGPKFWCPGMVNTSDSNNQTVFRYADAVLMQAECYCELQQWDQSINYLDKVKLRAKTEPYGNFKNADHLTEEIRKERARELLGEFQRKYDLVRWGIWYQSTYEYTNYETLRTSMKPCHEYYPIPDSEVAASGYALDNKAYAAYGM